MSGRRVGWMLILGSVLVAAALVASAGAALSFNSPSGNRPTTVASPHGHEGENASGNYSITFQETGLPSGACWSVALSNSQSGELCATSSEVMIAFSVPNGTYNFSVSNASVGGSWLPGGTYVPSPTSGHVTVAGENQTLPIAFSAPPTASEFELTFVETGLPAGAFWSVSLQPSFGQDPEGAPTALVPNCFGQWNGSNNSSIGFQVANGTYNFTVSNGSTGGNSSNSTYVPAPASGSVTVNGSDVQVNVTFSAVALYQLSFVETGLPNGTVWFVAISNGSTGAEWNGSANSSVDFLVPNGTYDFYVGNASSGDCWSNGTTYVPSPQFGNVTVNGSSVTEAIAFAPLAFYNLTFVASGLPNGTNWSVSIYNDSTGWEWNGSANLSVTFLVPNGTYNFSVENVTNGSALYVPAPMSGTVVVDGAAAVVDVAFSAVALYNVSFVESGLPNGTFWFVELTGGAAGWAANGSCNTTVSFLVPNGTYGFTIGGSFPDGFWNLSGLYTPSPAAGNLTVAGANVSVDVSFTAEALYSVTFSEIGLPNGTFWSVLIGAFPWTGSGNGSPAAVIGPACFQFWNGSNNSSISFALPNGTYPFFIGPVFEGSPCNVSAAFVAEPNNGTVTVNGTAVTVDVTFVPAPVPAPAPLASGGSPPGALAAHHPSPSASFPALAGLPLVGALGALAATLGALLLYLRRPLA